MFQDHFRPKVLRALILAKDFFRFAKVFASPKVSKATLLHPVCYTVLHSKRTLRTLHFMPSRWRLHSISLLSSPLSLMAEELLLSKWHNEVQQRQKIGGQQSTDINRTVTVGSSGVELQPKSSYQNGAKHLCSRANANWGYQHVCGRMCVYKKQWRANRFPHAKQVVVFWNICTTNCENWSTVSTPLKS